MQQPNHLWQEHLARLEQLHGAAAVKPLRPRPRRVAGGDGRTAWALHGELTANPPGRLGRPLLAEIEAYLEFFAIARDAGSER
jgi:hypothetical protein